MNKKVLLTSVAVLNTVAAVASPTVASAASTTQSTIQQTSGKDSDTNVIAGPDVKKADPTIAHSAVVQASSTDPIQPTIVESSNNYVSPAQQQAFLAQAVPMAQQAAAKYNVYASVMLAQAIIESAWGTSDLATMGNNLFGMKGDYNGSSISLPTSEWSASQGYYYINAAFRKYPAYMNHSLIMVIRFVTVLIGMPNIIAVLGKKTPRHIKMLLLGYRVDMQLNQLMHLF